MILIEMRNGKNQRAKDTHVHVWKDGQIVCGLTHGVIATVPNTATARGRLCRNCMRSAAYRAALLQAATVAIAAEKQAHHQEGTPS